MPPTTARLLCPRGAAWLLVLASLLGQAQRAVAAAIATPTVQFKRLGVEEGLSSNWVLAILRDRRGFLWVGTQNGLDRYDGQKIVNYHHVPSDAHSIPSAVAGVLYEDSRGRLWVGSRWASQGMARYDRDRDRFERLPQGPGGLSDPRVNAIVEAPGGRLWVGTAKGVDLVDVDNGHFENYGLAPLDDGKTPPRLTTALLVDHRGTLWVGTSEGLYLLNQESKRCVPWRGPDRPNALDGHRVEALLEDEAGTLWIATMTGGLFAIEDGGRNLRQYLPRAGEPASLGHMRTRSLALDQQGRLWVGTENGGLDMLDRRTGRFEHHRPNPFTPGALGSASIYTLLADRQGILWIGTYDDGLNTFSPLEQRFGLVTASDGGLRDPRVSAFLEDREGNLWIGTDGGGLCRIDARTGQYTYLTSEPDNPATLGSNSILTMAEAGDGALWAGGWGGGLSRLDPRTGKVTRFRHQAGQPSSIVSNDIWRVHRVQSGELVVATQRGTDLFDLQSGRASRLGARTPGVAGEMTITLAEERDGDLWLGQHGRAQHISRATGAVTTYVHDPRGPSQLEAGQVFAILEDSAQNVWIGGEGGLRCLRAGQPVGSDLLTIEGLPHQVVTSLLEDSSGNLWVTTHRGLSKLEGAVNNPGGPVAHHFDVHDGLQGSEFSRGAALRARDGHLFFGGPRGFNVFVPEAITFNSEAPPVVLTDLRVFNRSVLPAASDSPITRSITETPALSLSQDHFVVTFEFAALNLVLPQKNRYAYMLEGLERDWNQAGTRHEATYTQLRRGDYVLRVRAANNDGVWNEAGLALPVHVQPRWYEVTSTRVLLAGLGLLLVAGIIGWRVREFHERERTLTRRVEERTRALHELTSDLENRVRERTAQLELAMRVARRGEERYALAVRGAEDGLWDWDLAGGYLYLSPRWKAMLGYSESEQPSSFDTWLALVHPDDREGFRQAMTLTPDHPGNIRHEYRMIDRHGQELWFLCRGVVVFDEDGVPTRAAGSQTDITSRRCAELDQRRSMTHDYLTGLPNRSHFGNRLQEALQRVRQGHESLAVIFLGIDRFKASSDTVDPSAVDQILIEIASRLRKAVRGVDTLAKLRGDEFAVLLPALSHPDDATRVAEEIRPLLLGPFDVDGQIIETVASIGIKISSTEGESIKDVLRDANLAMSRARAEGTGRPRVFDLELRRSARDLMRMENGLKRALSQQEFRLHYQPIVDLGSHRPIGLEALIRWQDPERGLVPPNQFIGIAEACGLMIPLTEWVLSEACAQAKRWEGLPSAPIRIAINLPPVMISSPDLIAKVTRAVDEHHIAPGALTVEIVESSLLDTSDTSLGNLQALREIGIKIAIDDFGTGYSSLSYLQRLPVDYLKIDRSFTQGVPGNATNSAINMALLELASKLTLDTVAEGIETDAQAAFLSTIGCHAGQGYLFSKPLPADECEVFLRAHLV